MRGFHYGDEITDSDSNSTKPDERRLFYFSLRELLIFVTLVSIALGLFKWVLDTARDEKLRKEEQVIENASYARCVRLNAGDPTLW